MASLQNHIFEVSLGFNIQNNTYSDHSNNSTIFHLNEKSLFQAINWVKKKQLTLSHGSVQYQGINFTTFFLSNFKLQEHFGAESKGTDIEKCDPKQIWKIRSNHVSNALHTFLRH